MQTRLAFVLCLALAALAAAATVPDLAGWPQIPRAAAGKMLERYGPPDEASQSRLGWHERGKWSSIAVYRNEDFLRRSGVLEERVRFETPVGRWRDLSALQVGVTYDPLARELVASSESEEVNTLALNVAVDVIRRRRDVLSARDFYRKTLDLAMSGKSSRYTRELLFSPTRRPPAVPSAPESLPY